MAFVEWMDAVSEFGQSVDRRVSGRVASASVRSAGTVDAHFFFFEQGACRTLRRPPARPLFLPRVALVRASMHMRQQI